MDESLIVTLTLKLVMAEMEVKLKEYEDEVNKYHESGDGGEDEINVYRKAIDDLDDVIRGINQIG